MKQYLLSFASLAILALAASCNKENVLPGKPDVPAGTPVTLSLEVTAPVTRATTADSAEEARVETVDFFVFRPGEGSSYVVEAYKRINSGTSTSLTLTQGERKFCAVVNAPSSADYSSITTLAQLQQQVILLPSQLTNRYSMYGINTTTVSAGTTSVSIPVNRRAARIKIDKITNKIEHAGLAAQTLSLTRLFLINVAGSTLVDGIQTSKIWYATTAVGDALSKTPTAISNGQERTQANNLIYKKLASASTLAANASYTTAHQFYTFPENTADKRTCLVVEMKIGSDFYTYPVILDFDIAGNTSYEIRELQITRPGNPSDGDDNITSDEGEPIRRITIDDVNISVQDWTLELLGTDGTVVL